MKAALKALARRILKTELGHLREAIVAGTEREARLETELRVTDDARRELRWQVSAMRPRIASLETSLSHAETFKQEALRKRAAEVINGADATITQVETARVLLALTQPPGNGSLCHPFDRWQADKAFKVL